MNITDIKKNRTHTYNLCYEFLKKVNSIKNLPPRYFGFADDHQLFYYDRINYHFAINVNLFDSMNFVPVEMANCIYDLYNYKVKWITICRTEYYVG